MTVVDFLAVGETVGGARFTSSLIELSGLMTFDLLPILEKMFSEGIWRRRELPSLDSLRRPVLILPSGLAGGLDPSEPRLNATRRGESERRLKLPVPTEFVSGGAPPDLPASDRMDLRNPADSGRGVDRLKLLSLETEPWR